MSQFHPEYKILLFFIIKMLILKMVINAAKNKCSDVSFIFKGKARNVDYIFSCKLKIIGKIILYKSCFEMQRQSNCHAHC